MNNQVLYAVVLVLAANLVEGQQSVAPVGSTSEANSSAVQPRIEPVILARSSLDEKVVVLRLAPGIATAIRLPEPVNSVVLGDPESFQAEHSDHESELVTVKPITDQPSQTNLLITTTLGHQLNLLLMSSGQEKAGARTVDVLLTYTPPPGFRS